MNRHRKMRVQAGLSLPQMVDELRNAFPKCSKAALSMAENSDQTGVTLTREADAIYKELCTNAAENRKCPNRILGRLSDAMKAEFEIARGIMGHATVNEAVVYAVRAYIRHAKGKAAAGGSAPAAAD